VGGGDHHHDRLRRPDAGELAGRLIAALVMLISILFVLPLLIGHIAAT
jgi:hypothetical protein